MCAPRLLGVFVTTRRTPKENYFGVPEMGGNQRIEVLRSGRGNICYIGTALAPVPAANSEWKVPNANRLSALAPALNISTPKTKKKFALVTHVFGALTHPCTWPNVSLL